MRRFIGSVIGISAAMFGVAGAVALVLTSVPLGFVVHWSFFFGVLLVPVWLAGANAVMEWAIEFECGY